jgi:hypothetical protein
MKLSGNFLSHPHLMTEETDVPNTVSQKLLWNESFSKNAEFWILW